MNELLERLRALGLTDLADLVERHAADPTALSDDELAALEEGLVGLPDNDDLRGSDDRLAILEAAVEAAEGARGEATRREEVAAEEERQRAEEERRFAELADRLRGPQTPDLDPDPDTDPPADPDAAADPPADPDRQPEPVTAAGAGRGRVADRAAMARLAGRRAAPAVGQATNGARFVVADGVDGFRPNQEVDIAGLANALIRRAQGFRGTKVVAEDAVRVASAPFPFPEDRTLGDNAAENAAKLDAIRDDIIERARRAGVGGRREFVQSLTAAGDWCAIPQPLWDFEVLGNAGRPIRDNAVVTMAWPRGAVTSITPIVAEDFDDAIGEWSLIDDLDALDNGATDAWGDSSGVTKPCARITCPDNVTVRLRTITKCLIIGNMLGIVNPELVRNALTLLNSRFARKAETIMALEIKFGSVRPGVQPTILSAVLDVLHFAAAERQAIIDHFRIDENQPFTFLAPSWLLAMAKEDLAKRMPGDPQDNLAAAEQRFLNGLRDRGFVPIFSPDIAPMATTTTDGQAMADFPTRVEFGIYPVGSWIAGTLPEQDFGILRSPGLVRVNDTMTFAETHEKAHFMGTPGTSRWLTMDVCPRGVTAGTDDIPCVAGSGVASGV